MGTGRLIIVTAPSGAGKTTLVRELVGRNPDLCVSVSHTTRPRRPREEDGVNYHFVPEERFRTMLENGDFLESAEVYGRRYGTSRRWVDERLAAGRSVVLEIDWQGAAQVKRRFPGACHIFIVPPSIDTLKERLLGRGQDDDGTIEERMREARDVMGHVRDADYVVVNEEFEAALDDIQAIVRAEGLKVGPWRGGAVGAAAPAAPGKPGAGDVPPHAAGRRPRPPDGRTLRGEPANPRS